MDTRRFWMMALAVICLTAMAACGNTNDGVNGDGDSNDCVDHNPRDGYDDYDGHRCGKPNDDCAVDGGTDCDDGSTDDDDDYVNIDCGTPPHGGYFVAIMSNMTDRQEVVYLKARSDTEKYVQMQAYKPVCISVTPSEEPVIVAVLLKCGPADQPCPDPLRSTPTLRIKTIDGKDVFYYFGNEVNANLHELPVNQAMFMSAQSLGPLPQETNFRLYTEWILGP